MFRFTIRELLLLTVIVALGVGWWLRERQFKSEVAKALEWRTRAGALERILKEAGWDVEWKLQAKTVAVTRTTGRTALISMEVPTDLTQPSASDQ